MFSREGVALAAGLLFVATGTLIALTWDSFVESQVIKEFILTEKSKTYHAFVKTRIPVYIKFYFWNWTNPADIRDPDYKPILTEMGPYVYREITEKKNLVWNKNGTVTYQRSRNWYYEPDMSNGSLEDLVTTINVVANSAAFITRERNTLTRMGLDFGIRTSQTMSVTKTVREFLFEGYRNSLIDTAQNLGLFAGDIPFDRFGWFYKRNGSMDMDGVFNIETGTNGMESFGKIRKWNYWDHTPYFAGECGAVKGSGGEFFPPKRTKNDVIELFSPDLCRYVSFYFAKEVEQYGTNLYRYETKSSLFDNGDEKEEHSCFCSGECAPPGVLNVSSCRLGAPAFVSYPHFYLADSELRDAVEGMKPDPKKHGAHIIMEPTWGITYDVAARFQINMLVQPYDDISLYHGIKKTYFPVIWFEQTAVITQDTVQTINLILALPLIGLIVAAISLAIGAILISVFIIRRWCFKRKRLQINEVLSKQIEPMIKENGKDITINGYRTSDTISQWDTKL